jgi:putative ABC transport system permease protein
LRRWLDTLIQDLGYAVRSFRRSPAFVLVALLSLTLGIGATSAIFSVIHGVLIAPYPYARPGEIWATQVRGLDGRGGHNYSLDELRSMAGLPAFSDVMGTSIETVLAGELQWRSADRQRLQLPRRASRYRPYDPADGYSPGR